MANRCYLCSSSIREIYPSFVQSSYDSDQQTIATDVSAVPLLWMALFQPRDIVAKTFVAQGREVLAEAPVADKPQALATLAEGLRTLEVIFRDEGSLRGHGSYLADAVSQAPGNFVTIELSEISCLYQSEAEFFALFREGLGAMSDPSQPGARELLADIADLRLGRPFPPADLLLRDGPAANDDLWNHCRLLGAGRADGGIGRTVPWERP